MLLSTRHALAILGTACVLLVGGSVFLGEWLRIDPCPLCIFQRVLFLLIGFSLLIGTINNKFVVPALWVGGMLTVGGVGVAGYQSVMQLFPDLLPTVCGAGEMNLMEKLVDELGVLWPRVFMATGFCTAKDSVFGLTMANWSLLGFLWFGFWQVVAWLKRS